MKGYAYELDRSFLITNFLEKGGTYNIFNGCYAENMGGDVKTCLSCLNFSWHWSSQTNLVDFISSLITGWVLSPNQGMNQEIGVNLLMSRCTSLTF